MQGEPAVVDCLNELIRGELAARDQYLIHATTFDDLGLKKLYQHSLHESEHEGLHAKALIDRVLLLGGKPTETPHAINTEITVEAMLKSDLELEYTVQKNLKDAIQLCEQHQDYVSRLMLVEQLKDTEEDHAHWLEQQLKLIELMGLSNYLQSQIGESDEG
jgi:bacterioferritin